MKIDFILNTNHPVLRKTICTKMNQFLNNILLFSSCVLLGHEKILRGLAVGISLTMFNRLEESDALVTSLSNDKDPVLRRSGMYTIAMAYCGTGNNQAIRKLLHVAVSTKAQKLKFAYTRLILLFRSQKCE
jgi:hypothetical protein